MYLIVGASGYLGAYLIQSILQRGSEKIVATYSFEEKPQDSERVHWVQTDITDLASLLELENMFSEPVNVIFLAAYHKPNEVQKHFDIAWNVNIVALANFLKLFSHAKTFYYPSTEVVYGDSKVGHKFTETDPLHPANKYGELKEIAEKMVKVCGYNSVRFPVLMGPSIIPGRPHFYDEILQTLKEGRKIEMFIDNIRSFIDFRAAADLLLQLIDSPEAQKYPVVNIAGDQAFSKYEFALRIAEKHHLDPSGIVPVKMADSKVFTTHRATATVLDNSLLKKILGKDRIEICI